MIGIKDSISFLKKIWRINKFKDSDGRIAALLKAGLPLEEIKTAFFDSFIGEEIFEQNVALNEGLALMLDLFIGAGGTAFSNANAYLGVGDSSTGEDPSQTGLQAATNKLYKAMDGSYPQRTAQTLEFRSTFGENDANFDWNEFTVANGNSDSAVNLNRKVADKGTKAQGETWTLSLSVTAA